MKCNSAVVRAALALVALVLFIIFFIYCFNEGRKLTITIVHTNDLHAQFAEVDIQGGICKYEWRCFGGFSRLYTAWNEIKKEHNLLTFDAGDIASGSIINSVSDWSELKKIHKINYDAIVLGDDDIRVLLKMSEEERKLAFISPVVVSNLRFYGHGLKMDIRKYFIIERGGFKIGILGVINKYMDAYVPLKSADYEDEAEAIIRETKNLQRKGVFTIILLSHCGYKRDLEIAKKLPKDVSIIVGGHSHTILCNEKNSKDDPLIITGNYPTQVDHLGHKVLIVTAGYFGLFIGKITVTFGEKGDIRNFSGNPIFIDKKFENDAVIDLELAPILRRVEKQYQHQILATTSSSMVFNYCVLVECKWGNLYADALIEVVQEKDSDCIPQMALIAATKFRATILKGEITLADIKDSLQDEGSLVCLSLEGVVIKEAILQSFSEPFDQRYHRHVLQVSSSLKVFMYYGNMSVNVYYNGEMIKNTDKFNVLVTDYVQGGGDGFKMMTKATPVEVFENELQLFIGWMKAKKTITPKLDNRIMISQDPFLEEKRLIDQQAIQLQKLKEKSQKQKKQKQIKSRVKRKKKRNY